MKSSLTLCQKNKSTELRLIMKSYNLIIFQFINKAIFKSFLAILFILLFIVSANQLFIVFNQSSSLGFIIDELIPIILLKTLRDMPLVIALSMILSLTYSLNKFYKSSELLILNSSGYSDVSLIKITFLQIFLTASLILSFNVYIVPEVQERISQIRADANNRPDYIFFKEGVFQNFENNNLTFFTSSISPTNNPDIDQFKNIFIYDNSQNKLITAPEGKKIFTEDKDVRMELLNGTIYFNILDSKEQYKEIKFDNYKFNLHDHNSSQGNNSSSNNYKSIYKLISSSDIKDFSDLQFKLSMPFGFIMICLISIFLAKTNPRSKKNFSIANSVILFFIYFYSLISIKTLIVNHGEFKYFLTLFPHVVFIMLFFLLYTRSLSPSK